MTVVLDASMVLSWHFKRADQAEARLSQQALLDVANYGAVVPGLWYSEVANGLLVGERRGVTSTQGIAAFLADLAQLDFEVDSALPEATFDSVIACARTSNLTAYDATYLELALRTTRVLATFDQRLAEALRKAGGRVFGNGA